MNPNENEPTPPLTDEEREHRRVRYAQYWASKRVADEFVGDLHAKADLLPLISHDGPRSVSEADWLEFNTEANDYGVPDRAGLQSVIDVIGEHYLHLAREWGWNDTEVRDAMYVETKQRGWCRE